MFFSSLFAKQLNQRIVIGETMGIFFGKVYKLRHGHTCLVDLSDKSGHDLQRILQYFRRRRL